MTALAIILARATDTASTLHFNFSNPATALLTNSPLIAEGNPLVLITGKGARTLVLTNIVSVLVLLILPLWVYWRYPIRRCSQSPGNLREFISLQLYRRLLSKPEFIRALCLRLPKDWIQTARLLGFTVCWAIVGGSFMAAFNWWALFGWNWNSYLRFHDRLLLWNYPVLEPAAALIFATIAGFAFFKTDHADYRMSQAATRDIEK